MIYSNCCGKLKGRDFQLVGASGKEFISCSDELFPPAATAE
jgi:hypothetical protein